MVTSGAQIIGRSQFGQQEFTGGGVFREQVGAKQPKSELNQQKGFVQGQREWFQCNVGTPKLCFLADVDLQEE